MCSPQLTPAGKIGSLGTPIMEVSQGTIPHCDDAQVVHGAMSLPELSTQCSQELPSKTIKLLQFIWSHLLASALIGYSPLLWWLYPEPESGGILGHSRYSISIESEGLHRYEGFPECPFRILCCYPSLSAEWRIFLFRIQFALPHPALQFPCHWIVSKGSAFVYFSQILNEPANIN